MRRLHALSMLVIGLALTGCAVSTDPLVREDLLKRISLDRDAMYKDQEPVKAPISLEEAMARSIKYNLDHRLKIMEDAVALRQVDLMTFDMLPRLVAAAGYTQRDTENASNSINVFTREVSLQNSTSQERGHFNGDLTMTWNILDFGVSYMQAKQQADRAHIMRERRRKVLHTIMQQVRQAYWLAMGAQQLEGRFEPLLKDVEMALKDASSIEQEKLRPPIETLTYRKTLLEIMKQLEVFRDELAQAKPRLASLMSLPLGESFDLASPPKLETMDLPAKIEQMEMQALLMRPELLEADYNDRISVYETRKAIARMLPGMEMSVGGHYDSNSFLLNKKWIEGGARITWNLLNLISGPSQYKIAKSQNEIVQAQRLALSMAILTQVHVAYQDFFSRKRQFELSEQLQDVDMRIHEQTVNQAKSGSQSRLNEIRSATAALMAEYRSYQNYAALQNACGQIVATVGQDPLPETVDSHDVKPLAQAIGARLNAPGAVCLTTPSAPAPKPAAVAPAPSSALLPAAAPAAPAPVEAVAQPQAAAPAPVVETAPAQVVEIAQPKPAAAPKLCSPAVLSVEFDSSKWDVKPAYHEELKKLADFLKEFPQATGEIAGHTDKSGWDELNLDLSLRRAQSIRDYVVGNFGIDPKRVAVKGYGSAKPVADNDTPAGKQKNRRIETSFQCQAAAPATVTAVRH